MFDESNTHIYNASEAFKKALDARLNLREKTSLAEIQQSPDYLLKSRKGRGILNRLTINPIKTQKAYLQIVTTIIDLVVRGELEYGNRLYNEQELLTILGVSRPTLREALRVLEFLGIATVSPRRGIIINQPEDFEGYLPLLCILMFEKTGERELFELRRALQVEMAGLASMRHTEEELALLRDIVERTKTNLLASHDDFARLDYDFHLQIIKCAHNKFALKLMNTVGVLIAEQLNDIIRKMPVEKRQDTLSYHTRIADFVAQRDEQMAREVMWLHLKRPYGTMTDKPITMRMSDFLIQK